MLFFCYFSRYAAYSAEGHLRKSSGTIFLSRLTDLTNPFILSLSGFHLMKTNNPFLIINILERYFAMTIAITISLLVVIVFGISYFAYCFAFRAPRRVADSEYSMPKGEQYEDKRPGISKAIEEMLARPYESVTITSFDGKKLFARYYHVADGAPVQIMFHGYKSSAILDFSGGSNLAVKMGHNCLVVDQRSHGKSEGHIITFGIKERKDCLSWIHYARVRFGQDVSIILVGLSMGAATVLMAADQELPANVKGIIADCPYSSPKAIIQKVCKDIHFPPKFMYPFIRLGAFLFGHFQLEESSPVTAVQQAHIPLLLIHGEDDRFVPCEMSAEIQKACASPVTRITIPGAGHGLCYLVAPEKYEAAILRFMKSIL